MADIVRIAIIGRSGYCRVDEAFIDKVTIERDSIRYEYKPVIESEINPPRKWSYKTSSSIFQKLFREAAAAVEDILNLEEEPDVTDIGVTSFTITYADKTKATRDFILPGDGFKECFDIIKQMVPGCECTPAVLLTSEDYSGGKTDYCQPRLCYRS
ncbi:MAG: hypothetical protein K6D94_03235 [Clostridiales bacterium]|nr:hypothetical protein [Clostridiales bacterium]